MRTIIRVIGIPLCGVLLAAGALQSRSDEAPYTQVAKVPSVYDGQKFYSFAFDPVDRRLYAASEQGVFWVDLRDREPRIKGPHFVCLKNDLIMLSHVLRRRINCNSR
jgi:hypothetical protein